MTSWHGHCCGWEVQFCDKLTFWKEIESKCLLVHILLFMQFFFLGIEKFFLNAKLWQSPEKLSVPTLPKIAVVQWQGAMNLPESTNTYSPIQSCRPPQHSPGWRPRELSLPTLSRTRAAAEKGTFLPQKAHTQSLLQTRTPGMDSLS